MGHGPSAVYLLSNFTRTVLYTGVTNDLVRRIAEHRERMDPDSFTARYRVDRLVYYEAFDEIVAAIQREKKLKGWSRAKKCRLVARANPSWDDLWPRIAE